MKTTDSKPASKAVRSGDLLARLYAQKARWEKKVALQMPGAKGRFAREELTTVKSLIAMEERSRANDKLCDRL